MKAGLASQGRWLIALVAGVLAGAMITYLVLPRRAAGEGVDCRRVFATTDELNDFLAERAGAQPTFGGHPLSDVPAEEQSEAWAAFVEDSEEYMNATVAGFNASFAAETQFLVERLVAAGAWQEQSEIHVVNELGIRHLATELEAAALRTGCQR